MLMRKEREKMKKVLVVAAVLSMATLANAGITLSVNGLPAPDEITIAPSQTITIDVTNDLGPDPVNGDARQDFLLYLDSSPGAYDLSDARLGDGAGNFPTTLTGPYDLGDGTMEMAVNQAWAVGTEPTAGTIMLVDLHCAGPGDILITLWDDRSGYSAPVDQMIIHQVIPEPATLAILGLGALLLRRK
jgi:hypothetical protein